MLVIVLVASCALLVGIGYLMLDIFSGLVVIPRTPVTEKDDGGELVVPLQGDVYSLQVSPGGGYLAFIAGSGEHGKVLQVRRNAEPYPVVVEREVDGRNLAWVGGSESLVFEDGGDLFLLRLADGEEKNLTSSPEYDQQPLPSPDGSLILWTVGGREDPLKGDYWIMEADGSEKSYLAPVALQCCWSPRGDRLLALNVRDGAGTPTASYVIQKARPGEPGWRYFTEGEGEVLYVWWSENGHIYYVSPRQSGGNGRMVGVVFELAEDDPEKERKAASTEGIGLAEEWYSFQAGPEGRRLALVGNYGLEYVDLEEKRIFRYPEAWAGPPIAWDGSRAIYFAGAEGIHRISLD